jgi:hypothetical protein
MLKIKMTQTKTNKEKCAEEYLEFALKWTDILSPEEVLGIMETFKYVYLNKFVEKQVKIK